MQRHRSCNKTDVYLKPSLFVYLKESAIFAIVDRPDLYNVWKIRAWVHKVEFNADDVNSVVHEVEFNAGDVTTPFPGHFQ